MTLVLAPGILNLLVTIPRTLVGGAGPSWGHWEGQGEQLDGGSHLRRLSCFVGSRRRLETGAEARFEESKDLN